MSDITQAETAQEKFDGMNFDLDDLPTNKQLQDDAKNEGVWIRAAGMKLKKTTRVYLNNGSKR